MLDWPEQETSAECTMGSGANCSCATRQSHCVLHPSPSSVPLRYIALHHQMLTQIWHIIMKKIQFTLWSRRFTLNKFMKRISCHLFFKFKGFACMFNLFKPGKIRNPQGTFQNLLSGFFPLRDGVRGRGVPNISAPDCKKTVFLTIPLREPVKNYFADFFAKGVRFGN